jgi:hypothetical protein
MSALPAGNVPAATDSISIAQSGTNVAVTYTQFLSGLPGIANINGSQLLVTATGGTAQQRLADFAAGALPKVGGTLTGSLGLASDPLTALQAATKEYVDTRIFRSGDTMTGVLILAGDPSVALGATTKEYTDGQIARCLFALGGTMAGPLTLATNPTAALQATPKQYVDGQVATTLPLAGGTLSGTLSLAGNPSSTMQAATKQYVDSQVATALPLTGGTLGGPVTLPSNPTVALQAAPKQYVDNLTASTLPLVGGTLSGPLTLASAPTISLQAATKSYADTKVQKSGDTMTGPLIMSESFTGSGVPSLLAATRPQSSLGDSPLVNSSMTLALTGGAGSSNTNTLLTTNVGSTVNSSGNAVDGPGTEVYSLVSYLNSTALRPLGVSPVAAQHVSIQSAPTRSLPPGGVPAGRQMAQMWGLWLPTVDQTNLPSSISNSLTANETDLHANNVDDANGRFGLQLCLSEAIPLASGGYPLEWANGIITTTSATSQFKWMLNLQGNYSIAVIDTRSAFPNGSAGAPPKITTALTIPAASVHVSNVLPFTSAGVYGNPVSSTNTSQIKIGSDTYTQIGFSFDGPGLQSGTIILSTTVSVADGALGSAIANSSRTIWLASGQQIAFDYGGTINVFFDTSIGALHHTSAISADGGLLLDHNSSTMLFWDASAFSSSGGGHLQGNLLVSGSLYTPNGLTVGGGSYLAGPVTVANTATFTSTGTFQGAVSMSGGLTVSTGQVVAKGGMSVTGGLSVGSGTIGLPTYAVASLPQATVGSLAYATNGRKTGEAVGVGTGVLVVGSSSGLWISVMSGTTVLA